MEKCLLAFVLAFIDVYLIRLLILSLSPPPPRPPTYRLRQSIRGDYLYTNYAYY